MNTRTDTAETFRTSDYYRLSPDKQKAIEELLTIAEDSTTIQDCLDHNRLDEKLGIWKEGEGCVPDECIGDDLNNAIRSKIYPVIAAARNLSVIELEATGNSPDLSVIISPSHDDMSFWAVLEPPFCLNCEGRNMWSWHFSDLEELASEIIDIKCSILKAYHRTDELRKSLRR